MISKQHDAWIEHEIGLWLRETRLKSGRTQKEIGDLLGITYQQIQKYESATNRLSVMRLLAFCKAVDVLPHSLFLNVRYGHHANKHQYAGHHAAWIARRIADRDVLDDWLKLGESLARSDGR